MPAANVVVVTGASAGVGRASARAFAERGADVALLARDDAGLKAATAEVERVGRRALAIPTDVAEPGQVEAAAARTEAELGPIDIWVNNAMTSVFAPFEQTEPDEFRRATEVTYLGTVYGTKAALNRMLARDRGTIVCVGSALAYRGIPLQSAYCGAKHAIQGFSESVRCELLHRRSHVRITMVQLPAMNTPQFNLVRSKLDHEAQPVPPIYQPELAARAIVWSAEHPRRREVWVGGSTTATLLANSVMPGLLDRYLGRTGITSQQTPEPRRQRPDNLFDPVPGDHGTHGRFGERAHPRSPQLWATTHRGAAAAVAAGLGLAGAMAAVWASRRPAP